jgi:hypothetical protein
MISFSTVVALDERHLEEWELSWPTWAKFRPEILQQPLHLLVDNTCSVKWWRNRLGFVRHSDLRLSLVEAPPLCVSQREKMLSAFVLLAPKVVDTSWMLKVDTDAVARHADSSWCANERIAQVGGVDPVYSSSPWAYTKPAQWLIALDEWGNDHPVLKRFPPLGLQPPPHCKRFGHSRTTSWCFFGQTTWCRGVAEEVGRRLPIPSHDTLLWYWAVRTGQTYRREAMKRFGWDHVHARRLASVVKSILNPESVDRLTPSSGHKTSRCLVFESILRDLQPKRGAEIGVAAAELSSHLLRVFSDLTLHLVDPWCTFREDHPYRLSGDRRARMDRDQVCEIFHEAMRNVAFAGERAVVHKSTSAEAAVEIPDRSLDFVFIDADHTYAAVTHDLEAWFPKIRSGGIFAGHDFGARRDKKGIWGVAKATQEFAAAKGLTIHLPGATVWYARL